MSNSTSALHLESAVASAFSIGVGCAGCVVLFIIALMFGGVYWHTRRAVGPANFKIDRAISTVGRIALLAFLYLIVGTNQVTWERPSDGERNNLLRVVLGLLVNLAWLDFLVCQALPKDAEASLTTVRIRNKLIRPAVRVLVVVATMTVGASPTAREFALVLTTLVLLTVIIMPVAVLRWPILRADRRRRVHIIEGGCTVAGGLLFLGELLSPSYVGIVGNGPALLFMLVGHLILAVVYGLVTWLDMTSAGHDTAPPLSMPSPDDTHSTSLMAPDSDDRNASTNFMD